MKNRNLFILMLLVSIFFIGCTKEGPEGKKSLLDMLPEPIGENCSSGGFKVISGIDINSNDILDSSEIQNSEYICNGSNGRASLLNIIPEAENDKCSNGGYKVQSGVDTNENAVLDPDEITATVYLCNGVGRMYLGDTETGFLVDSIYQANSDGFLSVQYNCAISVIGIDGKVYSDSTLSPATIAGTIRTIPGSVICVIKNNDYWKVGKVQFCNPSITWIPIVEW